MTRNILFFLSLTILVIPAFCQSDVALIGSVLKANMDENAEDKKETSVFKSIKLAKRPYLFLPASMMWAYRNVVSEQITAECAYELSCSRFSAKSILKYGFIRGVWLTTDRLSRCNQMSPEESYLIWLDKNTGRIIDEPEMYR